ncbi:MAG: hypothetical protein BAJALOKI1v1_1070009 [Promethearchaeota archaeon]|nr:MAG: hypothetical protein BAJALOKI1v1_1070009 [Candidatus Lokiarchaeota archaeon]
MEIVYINVYITFIQLLTSIYINLSPKKDSNKTPLRGILK